MVVLDVAALRAPAPVLRDEGALPAVALPDGALDVGRDVARPGFEVAAWPRLRRRRERLLLDLPPEQLERPGDDHGGIAVRDLAAHQVLQAPEIIVRLLTHGELETVAFRREWGDDRTMGRGLRASADVQPVSAVLGREPALRSGAT